jgi:glutaredoxin
MLDVSLVTQIGNRVRTAVGDALSSTRMDGVKPVRALREVLGTANDLFGRPFCTSAELAERNAVVETTAPPAAEPAPVVVYFDGKDHRTKKKVEELLQGKNVPFRVLDVADDEATRSFAVTAAKADEFPLVFIAGTPVGGLHELMQLDVNGQLQRMVFGP